MKFKYSGQMPDDPSQPWTWRPMLKVAIFGAGGGEEIRVTGLVDSGADEILFNSQIAEAVGVDLTTCTVSHTMGIEGVKRDTYKTEIDIQVSQLERLHVPVAFIDQLPIPCLLGQTGFFDAYRIKFARDQKRFDLVPVKKK